MGNGGEEGADSSAAVRPVLAILTGISFAGKSVLARALGEAMGFAVVDPDEVGRGVGLGLRGEFLGDAQWATIRHEY